MKKFDRDKHKKYGIKRLINSFKYAFSGILSAYKQEQNILIHTFIAIAVVILGFIFSITSLEWIIIILSISIVFAFEFINSSIEAAIDLVTDKICPLAKIAKDLSSSAVLITSIGSGIIGLIIFLPYFLKLF